MKSEFVRIIPRVSFYSFIYQAAILIVQKQHKINIYRPQTKLRKGFYTCLSVILFMGGSVSQHALGHTDTPWADNPLPSACWDTPPPGSHCCGHYASYWNAFLCFKFLFCWYCFYLRTVNVRYLLSIAIITDNLD